MTIIIFFILKLYIFIYFNNGEFIFIKISIFINIGKEYFILKFSVKIFYSS